MTSRIAYLEAVVGADITSFRRGMTEARGMLLSFGSDVSERMRAVGRSMTLGITVPVAAIGTAVLGAAIDFDAAMRNVASISDQVANNFASSSAEVLEWGASLREGPVAAANALNTVMQAGFGIDNFAEALQVAEISAFTAEAGMADLTVTTEALVAALLSYSGTADDAAYYSDVLTRMVQVGVGTMGEFGNALAQVLPSAATLGVEFDQLGGLMAYLTQRGFPASRAATSLGNAFNKLITPSEAMNAVWQELGVTSGRQLIDTFGGVQGALNAIFEIADRSPDAARLLAEMFPDERGRRAIQLAMADVDAFNATMNEFFEDVTGATGRAHAEQMKSFAAQLDLLRSAAQRFMITVGNIIAPEIMPFINQMADAFNRLAELNPDLIKFGVALVGVAAALGPLIWIMGAILTPGGLLLTLLSGLAAIAFTDFNGWGTAIRDELYRVLPALRNVHMAFVRFFQTLFSDAPIVEMRNTLADQFRDSILPEDLTGQWNTGFTTRTWMNAPGFGGTPNRNTYNNEMDDFIPNDPRFNQGTRGTIPFMTRLAEAIEASLPQLRAAFLRLFRDIADWISGTAIPVIDDIGGNILDAVTDAFTTRGAVDGRTQFAEGLRSIFTGGASDVKDSLTAAFNDLFPSTSEGLTSLFDRIGIWFETEAAPSLGYAIGYFAVSLGNLIAEILRSVFGGYGKENPIVKAFRDGFQQGWQDAVTDINITDGVDSVVSAIVGGIVIAFAALSIAGKGAITLSSALSGFIVRGLISVVGWITSGGIAAVAGRIIGAIVMALSGGILSPIWMAQFTAAFTNFISTTLGQIGAFLTTHPTITAAIGIIGSSLIGAIAGIFIWNNLTAEQQEAIRNALLDLFAGLFNTSRQAVQDSIDNWAADLQRRIADAVADIFRIFGRGDIADSVGSLGYDAQQEATNAGVFIGESLIGGVGTGIQNSLAEGTPVYQSYIENSFNTLLNDVGGRANTTGRKLAQSVKDVHGLVMNELTVSFGTQKDALTASIESFSMPTTPFTNALNNVLNAIRPIIDSIVNAWNSMLAVVGGAVPVPAVTGGGGGMTPAPKPAGGGAPPPRMTPIVKPPAPVVSPKGPIRTRAGGGMVHAGVPYKVHKDETLVPSTNGMILNKRQSSDMSKPSMNQTNYIQIVTNDADKLLEDLRRRGIDLKKGIRV